MGGVEAKESKKAGSKGVGVSKSSRFRKISKDKYVTAGVIAFLIFALGMTLGLILEEQRYNWAEELSQQQEVNYQSLQLQYLFLTAFEDEGTCSVLLNSLQDAVRELSSSLSQVVEYEKETSLSDEDFELISRLYVLDNIRYWFLASQAQESCDLDILPILYFYAEDCPSCPNQGTVLTYFKKILDDQFLVFPIDLDLREEEPMVGIIMDLYNVDKYPTLVIEGEIYEGVVKKEEMQEIICANLEGAEGCEV